VYIDILNRSGVTHECDKWKTDRRTDRHVDSKGRAHYVASNLHGQTLTFVAAQCPSVCPSVTLVSHVLIVEDIELHCF